MSGNELRLKVATVWRKEWSAEVAYNVLDEVIFSSKVDGVKRGVYRSLLAANREPLSNENAWVLILDLERTQSATEEAEVMTEAFDKAETGRVEAENKRVSAESGRVTAENGRVSDENGRVTAENGRVSAESGRADAESNRRKAEETRISNEQARVTAENNRIEVEKTIISNEQARVSAENNRVTAESDRAKAFTTAQNERAEDFNKAEAERDAKVNDKVGDITRLQEEVAKKANFDGYYSSMAVGAAENLIGQNVTTQQFTFQPSGNTLDVQDGLAVIKSIKGNTVVANQMVNAKKVSVYTAPSSLQYIINKPFPVNHLIYIKVNYICQDEYPFERATIYLSSFGDFFGSAVSFNVINDNSYHSISYRIKSSNSLNNTIALVYPGNATGLSFDKESLIAINLTQMFGAGNEPTVEEFEKLYPNLPTGYNAGSLLNLNADSIKSVDGVKESIIELPIKQCFSDGMKAVGNDRDEIVWIEEEEKYRVIQRIGSRAYQTGDEEIAGLMTDKTNTYYVLESPVESFIDKELIKYKVWNEGAEEILSDEPTTPIVADIVYGVDAVKTLNRLPQNYISVESMRGFLAQLGSAMGGSWIMVYDEVNSKWTFAFTANAMVANEEKTGI